MYRSRWPHPSQGVVHELLNGKGSPSGYVLKSVRPKSALLGALMPSLQQEWALGRHVQARILAGKPDVGLDAQPEKERAVELTSRETPQNENLRCLPGCCMCSSDAREEADEAEPEEYANPAGNLMRTGVTLHPMAG